MVERCIGIDIGQSYLCAVQVSFIGQDLCIERVFSTQTRRSSDSQLDILRSLVGEYGFDRRSCVVVSMPHNALFFRELQTDFAGLEQIREHTSSALQHCVPIEPDETVAQLYSYRQIPDNKFSALTAAVTRKTLCEQLNVLSRTRMYPVLVDAAIFAIHSTVAVNHHEIAAGRAIIAYVDELYLILAVTQDNNILIVRNIPIVSNPDPRVFLSEDSSGGDCLDEHIAELLSREVRLTWRRVFADEVDRDTKIYLALADRATDSSGRPDYAGGERPSRSSGYLQSLIEENLHCQIVVVDPCARVNPPAVDKSPSDYQADFPIFIAEGLALRILAPQQTKGVNFLEADGANIQPALNLKKELITFAGLVGAIAFFLLVSMFVRLSRLESDYMGIKNQIREVFQTTLPQENIVSPLVQVEQKLDSFRRDYQLFASFCPSALSPLEVLQSISANTPSQDGLKVDDMLIADDKVRIKGICNSFESVYRWQQFLRQVSYFTQVDVQDVQKEPDSDVVHFTILLSLTDSPMVREQE